MHKILKVHFVYPSNKTKNRTEFYIIFVTHGRRKDEGWTHRHECGNSGLDYVKNQFQKRIKQYDQLKNKAI